MFPGGPQNFHNVPPRQHGHGQPPVNQPVAVYGHQLEAGQHPPPGPPMQHGGPQSTQPPPPAPPPFGSGGANVGMMSYQSSVPVQNINGQPNINFTGQPMQNMPHSMKDAFHSSMDPNLLPPPGVQGGNPSAQFITVSTTGYTFGMGHHLYPGKVPEMQSDMPLGGPAGQQQGGIHQTMLLPTASNTQHNLERQHVRPGMVPLGSNPADNVLGIHISQFGGLSAAQIESMELSASPGPPGGPGLGGKLLPSGGGSNAPMEVFSLHHLPMDGPNSLSGAPPTGGGGGVSLGGGTVVTPSASYIVMAPTVFPATGRENINPNSATTFNSSNNRSGNAGGVVPIGTERAQKATLSAFPISSGMVAITGF